MPSPKTLLGFNAAILFAAYMLYSAGYRITLDEGSGSQGMPPLNANVAGVSSPASPSYWGGSGGRTNYSCENLRMRSRFLSYDPIMVYIENFMSPYERRHLKDLANSQYTPSVVESYDDDYTDTDDKNTRVDTSTRKSETAWLSDGDPVVDCVKARAAEFEGFAPGKIMEELAVLKYSEGGSFTTHYDWHSAHPQPIDRRTSFFATLQASDDIKGGATWFPFVVQPAWNSIRPWCDWLDCGYDSGLAVRPIPGNALFWVNFREDGSGHEDTAHGGEPVIQGTKIGMNIWTRARVKLE